MPARSDWIQIRKSPCDFATGRRFDCTYKTIGSITHTHERMNINWHQYGTPSFGWAKYVCGNCLFVHNNVKCANYKCNRLDGTREIYSRKYCSRTSRISRESFRAVFKSLKNTHSMFRSFNFSAIYRFFFKLNVMFTYLFVYLRFLLSDSIEIVGQNCW